MQLKERVLVVEDNKLISLALQKKLILNGFDVIALDSLRACEDALTFDRTFFVAVLDLNLPDAKDGEIVDYVLSCDIPVLVLTAVLDDSARDMMLSKNIIDYVLKGGDDDIEYAVSLISRLRKNRTKKALVIDDSATYREMLKTYLLSLMFEVVTAKDGQEGLSILKDNRDIELCIIDYHMPKMDGLEFTRVARKLRKTDEMAIVAITAWGSNDVMAKFLKVGANGYLNKPFTKEDFNFKIMGILSYFDIFERLQKANTDLEKRVHDELEKRQLNEQMLIHQSKLAAMGEMLNAIAHQWRQPLNALGIITQSIEDEVPQEHEHTKERVRSKIGKAMEFIQYMSKTINDFRSFFRQDKEKIRFNVKSVINETVSLFKPQLESHGIKIKIECEEEIEINGYRNEYKQAVLNILSNALYQLKHRKNGKIEICIKNEDNRSVVNIHDNGGGIPNAIIDRVFEPYFTTKPEGEGSGVGLYMTKVIIEKNMGGKIRVQNIQDGALFTIIV